MAVTVAAAVEDSAAEIVVSLQSEQSWHFALQVERAKRCCWGWERLTERLAVALHTLLSCSGIRTLGGRAAGAAPGGCVWLETTLICDLRTRSTALQEDVVDLVAAVDVVEDVEASAADLTMDPPTRLLVRLILCFLDKEL